MNTSAPSRLPHCLAAMLSLIIAVPVALMGVGVAAAAPFVPMGHTAAGLPIYDLQETLARPEYSNVQIDTTNVTKENVINVNGFEVDTSGTYTGWIRWRPTKKNASLRVTNIGTYRTSDGKTHRLQGDFIVNDYQKAVFSIDGPAQGSNAHGTWFGAGGDYKYPGTTAAKYMNYTLRLLDENGNPMPENIKGLAGFQDLDGEPNNGPKEGVQLLGGFDGAYIRRDTHLAQYGFNGWNGGMDHNDNLFDDHAQKHYLGVTFAGNTLKLRYDTVGGRQASVQPIKALVAYELKYDPNAPDTNNGVPAMNGDGIPTQGVKNGCLAYYVGGDTINLATPLKDSDCWDATMLTRPGHTFLGWSRDKNSTTPEHQITMPEGNITVYAIWAKDIQFTYDADVPSDYSGAVPQVPDMREFSPGSMVPNVSPWQVGSTGILRGYRFDGWKVARDNASAAYGFDNTPLNVNTTVYAAWTPLTINLHYDPNGGEGSHASQNTRWDTTVGIPGNVNDSFHKDGFRLTGWNTKPDGTGKSYQPNGKVPMVDKDVTLYAQWEPVVTTMPETGSRTLAWALGGVFAALLLIAGSAVMLVRIRRKN